MRALLFALLMLALPICFKSATGGFHVAKLAFEIPPRAEWAAPVGKVEGPFRYLGRGSQCYAFVNGDVVLKFLRFDKARVPFWKRCLGWEKEKQKVPPFERVERSLNSCALAFREAREETGLLAVHLNPTEGEWGEVVLELPLCRSVRVSLDRHRFLVQRRAVQVETLFQQIGHAEKRERIRQLFGLIARRAKKGIVNRDLNVLRNFGFAGDQPVEFDFGCYIRSGAIPWQDEVTRFGLQLEERISDPELALWVHEAMEEALQ